MNLSGFISIDRKILEWEWYLDINTKNLFFHCLLMANWKDARFMGHDIPRGSFVTSLPQLATQTNMTISQVRTALSHLKMTGELTVKSQAQFSIITVNNYSEYQDVDRPIAGKSQALDSQIAGSSQANRRQIATIEQYNNITKEQRNKETREGSPIELEPFLTFGVFGNVELRKSELLELKDAYPDNYQDMIENLSSYMRSTGKHYDDHFATLMRWARKDKEQKEKPKGAEELDEFYDMVQNWAKNAEAERLKNEKGETGES